MITTLDSRTALVLIDLQKGIVQFPLAHPVQGVLEQAAKLVAAFRRASLPIVVVRVKPSGSWTKSRKDAVSQRPPMTDDQLEITPEIITHPDDVFITKQGWNAFYETGLDEELKKRNITGIVIAGISTSIGVEGTARAASERGYQISFARDAMTDMIPGAHENSINCIFPRMGEIGDTEKIVERLREKRI
jgi:nicotinamidase-related amidase